MANPIRGEVELKAGATSHTLRLGVQAMMMLEKRYGASIPGIMRERFSDPNNLMVTDVHGLIWAALQRGTGGPSEAEVSAIMDDAGFDACGQAVGELMQVTFASEEAGSENPPEASPTPTGGK